MSSIMDAPPPPTCQHPSHPAHNLTLVQMGGAQFRCDGCKQGGQDRRYRCQPCDFDLHIQCALAPPVLRLPRPIFGGSKFTLCSGMAQRFCDACGDAVLGIVYHDSQADVDLHPCCAFLKDSFVDPAGRVFQLRKEVAASCMLCGQNGLPGKFWSYALHANGGVENIHVACRLYADQNPAGHSRSTYNHQTTANPTTYGHQTTGNPTYGQQMTGNPTYGHQIMGNPTYGHQMMGNPTYGHQIMGNPTYGHQIMGNPTCGNQMTGNSTSGHHQMTGNSSSSQMMTAASVFGVVGSINACASLANNVVDLVNNFTDGDANEQEDDGGGD